METLENYLAERYTPTTATRYLRAILVYLDAVGHRKAETATYSDIINYIGALRKTYNNPVTIQSILQSIKKYYNWLNHSGRRKDNPGKAIRLRDGRKKDIQLQDLFTPGELELLMERKARNAKLKIKNQVIISLLIYQGLISTEICRLTVKDIDLDKGTVYVPRGCKTNRRTLKLKPKQIMLFYKYIHEVRPYLLKRRKSRTMNEDSLIINRKGLAGTSDGVRYLVESFRTLFPERNLNPTTIRQSVITNLLKQGTDLRHVQVFAGHRYPSATEQYKQNNVEELKKAIEKYHPLK